MKEEIALLVIAGLFSKAKINDRLVERAKQFFGVNSGDAASIDLEGLNDVEEARNYIQSQIMALNSKSGKKVGILGHSAGGQQALCFRYNPSVAFVAAIDPPNHNPFWLPLRAWLLSAKYTWQTWTNKAFRPSDKDSVALFGRSLPAEMQGNSRGKLVNQMTLGFFTQNKARKELDDEDIECPCLLVATTGDPLISEHSVEFTQAGITDSKFLVLDHPDHFPQLGPNANENIDEILESIADLLHGDEASSPGT